MLMLFGMALVASYVHGSLLFEQRTSANQYRSARAFEAAEAGLEWATALLNDPRPIDGRCIAASAGKSFRETYAPETPSHAFAPPAGAVAACRITADEALACSCPGDTGAVALGAANDPTFAVRFEAVADEPAGLRVTAIGCTSQATPCVEGSIHGRADAHAGVSVVLKRRPLLRTLPAAALTAGGAVETTGPLSLSNVDATAGGWLVEAGGAVAVGVAATLATVPGSPEVNAIAANEPSLHALAVEDADGAALFSAFFGMRAEDFGRARSVMRIDGDSAEARADALRAAHAEGFSAFELAGDVLFDGRGAGSPSRPVLIVTRGRVACSEACTLHGLLYVDVAEHEASDLQPVRVRGAFVARGAVRHDAGGSVEHDLPMLQSLRRRTDAMVRVPGSWRDF
jgi:hypothetical protein